VALGVSLVLRRSRPEIAGLAGAGVIVTDQRDLPAFHEVQIEGPTDVEITIGGAQSTVLTVDDNIRDHIVTEVHGGELRIWTDARSLTSGGILRITVPELDGVEIRGSGDAIVSGLDGGSFDSRILGSGDIRLAGTVSTHDLQILGSGEIDAADLSAGHVGANIAGSGSVRVDVLDSLDIKIVGSGDLEYSGDPDVDRIVIGSGSVRHVR
jgi:hypothetical protein